MCSPECTEFSIGKPAIAIEALCELRDLLTSLQKSSPCDKASLASLLSQEERREIPCEVPQLAAESSIVRSCVGKTSSRPTGGTRPRSDRATGERRCPKRRHAALYAGAYAYGKTETRTRIVEGQAYKPEGHSKPPSEWMALIQDHHAGYISWEQYERNQVMIAANANMKSRMEPKTGRGGRALLAGLLRCRRCGRMLHVEYAGRNPQQPRYHCHGAQLSHGEDRCISFGGWRADQAVAQKVLEAIGGNAVEAALQAAEQMRQQRKARQRAAEMELEQARYEARLAERRYEAVDPEQRLVAAELESRWNAALQKVRDLEKKLQTLASDPQTVAIPSKEGRRIFRQSGMLPPRTCA